MALTDGPMDLAQIGGGVAQAGIGAATGNPIALIAGVAGIATSLFGTSQEAKAQKAEAAVSTEVAEYEEQINQQRQQLATDIYQRQQTETLRKAQQGAAVSRAAAVQSGGAPGSSGYVAGKEQAQSEAGFNLQGLYQNYQIGQNIFGLTSSIDADKIRLAQLGGAAATGAGTAQMGQTITSGAMALGRLSGGFGGTY